MYFQPVGSFGVKRPFQTAFQSISEREKEKSNGGEKEFVKGVQLETSASTKALVILSSKLVDSSFLILEFYQFDHLYERILYFTETDHFCYIILGIDGLMTCDFYFRFNSISVISGRWVDDNEMPCAMEPSLRLKNKNSPQAGHEPGTANSAGH